MATTSERLFTIHFVNWKPGQNLTARFTFDIAFVKGMMLTRKITRLNFNIRKV
jgi:hypothetical protein